MIVADQDAFLILSARVAKLVVGARQSPFGLTRDRSEWRRHGLGFRMAPLYELEQPGSPDDGWEVRPRAGGQFVREAASGGGPAVDAAERWAGTGARQLAGALNVLPTGSYFIVRSPRVAARADRILLGNQLSPARPNFLTLRDEDPVYACLVGSDPGRPPRWEQPLIGFAVANYVGAARMDGVLFFSFGEPPREHPRREDGELFLVIPIDGELVLDNMGEFSTEDEQRSLARWRDERSVAFARWCAGEP